MDYSNASPRLQETNGVLKLPILSIFFLFHLPWMRVVRVSIMTVVNISKNNDLQRNSGWDLRTERCGEWGLRRSLVWEVTVVHWSGHTRIWRSLDGDGCCLGRTWSRFIEAVKHRCWVILVYPTHQGGGLSCAGRTETTDCGKDGYAESIVCFFQKERGR